MHLCQECLIETERPIFILNYGGLCPICYELLNAIRFETYWIRLHLIETNREI